MKKVLPLILALALALGLFAACTDQRRSYNYDPEHSEGWSGVV